MFRSKWLRTACAGTLVGALGAQAALLVHESFTYTPTGSFLVGAVQYAANNCNGGTGFATSPVNGWFNPLASSALRPKVFASGLSYPAGVGLAAPSGKNWRMLKTDGTFGIGYAGRYMAAPIDFGANGTYYISFLIQSAPTNQNGFLYVQLADAAGNVQAMSGLTGTMRARMGYGYTGFTVDSSSTLSTNDVYMLVGKITTAAGTNSDTYQLFYYKVGTDIVPSSEPTSWTQTYRTNLANASAVAIGIAGGDASPNPYPGGFASNMLDEIRIGTTWFDVTGNKTTPTINTNPVAASITYGQTLASATLSGGSAIVGGLTAVGGSFAFTSPGTVPTVGTSSQPVTFTPIDSTAFNTASASINVTVTKATPTLLAAPTAADLSYGQALSASVLSGGAASVPGTFAFVTPATTPGTGTSTQSVRFTPTDSANYDILIFGVNVTVNKATPTVTLPPTASALVYGQSLSASVLSGGAASVPGSFAFASPATAPNAGTGAQAVNFTPTDSANYNTVALNVNVTVSKATPILSVAPTAAAITLGQTLAAATLSGGSASVPGSFAFTAPATAPGAGTASYQVTFTPADGANYNTFTLNVSVTVNKATPTITTAPTAAAITYGQALSASSLGGGAASVSGTFAFTTPATAPATGTASQPVTFTPTDTVSYENVSLSVSVTVNKATPVISAAPTASTIIEGQALSASVLSGGSASVAGSFAFTTPATVPALGTTSQSVTFTPTDTGNYNTTTTNISVTVAVNQPPVLANIGQKVVNEGQSLSFNVTATDANGTVPQLAVRGLPVGASFTITTNSLTAQGAFSWTPTNGAYGIHPVLFTVTDGRTEDSESIRIYVGHTNESLCSGIPCSLSNWAPSISAVLASTTNAAAEIAWDSVDGALYNLFTTTNPYASNASWSVVGGTHEGNGNTNEVTDGSLGSSTKRYYRLALAGDAPGTNKVWAVIRNTAPAGFTMYAPPVRVDGSLDGEFGQMLAGTLTGDDDGVGGAGDEVFILQTNGAWRTLYLDSTGVWRESDGSPSAYKLSAGQGLLVKRSVPSTAQITATGPVGNDATQTNRVVPGWNIVGLSQGVSLPIKSAMASANPVGAGDELDADMLIMMNSDGSWRRMMYVQGWGSPYDGTWFDLQTFQTVTNKFEPGAAAYYYRQPSGGNADIRF